MATRSRTGPSLYPDPSAPPPSAPAPPPPTSTMNNASPAASSSANAETLPPDYEIILEIQSMLCELHPPSSADASTASLRHSYSTIATPVLTEPVDGTLRIIQGPLPASSSVPAEATGEQPQAFYHAFLSIGPINIPFMPTAVASRQPSDVFFLAIPGRAFSITPHRRTEPELTDALEKLFRWFCQWQPATQPDDYVAAKRTLAAAAAAAKASGAAPAPVIDAPLQTEGAVAAEAGADQDAIPTTSGSKSADKIHAAGEKGVLMVERVGMKVHQKIAKVLDDRIEAVRDEDQSNLRLGGKVTSSVLMTTRKVVGAGASVASKLTDKVSEKLGTAVGGSLLTRNLAEAPEGSLKRGLYENLMAGMMAFGRVYVAADTKGKLIIEDTGERAAELAGLRYGKEAESAARNVTGIALDGYRISRFPQKLGATSILKGAVSSRFSQKVQKDWDKSAHIGAATRSSRSLEHADDSGRTASAGGSTSSVPRATMSADASRGHATADAARRGGAHSSSLSDNGYARATPPPGWSVEDYREMNEAAPASSRSARSADRR